MAPAEQFKIILLCPYMGSCTCHRKTQLPADHLSISSVPAIITYCAPYSCGGAHLYSALSIVRTSNKPQLCFSTGLIVICRQLGFSMTGACPYMGIIAHYFKLFCIITQIRAYYDQGTGPILYDSVGCLGNESVLQQCAHKTITQHNCGHHEDAGVSCQPLGNHTLPRLRWHTFKILLS